jgi:hypothetical protein
MNIRRFEQRETTGPNKSVISSRIHTREPAIRTWGTLGIEPFEGHVRMEENIEQLRRDRVKETGDKKFLRSLPHGKIPRKQRWS